jgi:hypothetical protein
MTGSVARTAARALAESALFGAAVDLLKHVRHNAKKRDDQAAHCEEKADRLPQRSVTRKPGLITRTDQCHTAGDEREKQESCGKDVKITGHFF